MTTEITLPALGESVSEATVTRWLVAPGDSVLAGQPVCEVATDKVDTEVNATLAGAVSRLVVEEGAVVRVGEVLAMLTPEYGTHEDDVPVTDKNDALAAPPSEQGPEEEIVVTHTDTQEHLASRPGASDGKSKYISPAVRKIATEHGIEVSVIRGSGRYNRVTQSDVREHLAKRVKAPATPDQTHFGLDTTRGAFIAQGFPVAVQRVVQERFPGSESERTEKRLRLIAAVVDLVATELVAVETQLLPEQIVISVESSGNSHALSNYQAMSAEEILSKLRSAQTSPEPENEVNELALHVVDSYAPQVTPLSRDDTWATVYVGATHAIPVAVHYSEVEQGIAIREVTHLTIVHRCDSASNAWASSFGRHLRAFIPGLDNS